MEQNKTGKYLKYAIGEIVLVVIGILIALSINNWNEHRKERNEEKVFLHRLLDEMILDSTRLEGKIKLSQYKINGSNFILKELENANRSYLDTLELVIETFAIAINVNAPSDLSTYEELISMGKLNIIGNNDIKLKLSRYKRIMNLHWAERDRELSTQFMDYKKHLHHFFSALISTNIFKSPNLNEFKKLGIDVNAYVAHPETIYHIRNIALGNERVNWRSKAFLDNTVNPLIQIIREELDMKQ